MKTNEVYKKGIEEFEKYRSEYEIESEPENYIFIGLEYSYHFSDFKEDIKTIILNILKSEIDRLAKKRLKFGVKYNNGWKFEKGSNCDLNYVKGYNDALQEQIDYYQEQIKDLTNKHYERHTKSNKEYRRFNSVRRRTR